MGWQYVEDDEEDYEYYDEDYYEEESEIEHTVIVEEHIYYNEDEEPRNHVKIYREKPRPQYSGVGESKSQYSSLEKWILIGCFAFLIILFLYFVAKSL